MNSSGINFDNSYPEIPNGWLVDSRAYCASILSIDLQTRSPIVGFIQGSFN